MEKNSQFYKMFLSELRDVYDAENQIIRSLPKVINAATSKELKDSFKQHLNETEGQKKRLEKVFNKLGETPTGEHCNGIEGLIKETEKVVNKSERSFVEDAELIACAQKIEHYEIAAYGTLRTFANHLELSEVEDILQEILNEEGKTNKNLTKLAEGSWIKTGINAKAAAR